MGVSSYVVGLVPLKGNVGRKYLNLASAFGMGVMAGTALAVVIPEGVEMSATALSSGHLFGFSLTFLIGVSLLSGFVTMYLVDQLVHSPQRATTTNGEVKITWKTALGSIAQSTLTSSLLLHATIDGVALGSSFLDDHVGLRFAFFLAIIVHKLPTAFSFTAILLLEGISQNFCILHLVLFSLASPVAAVLTCIIVSAFDLNSPLLVGILFLFSAGTFLYSVVHVMMEVLHRDDYLPLPGQLTPDSSQISTRQLALSVAGMILPVFFGAIDSH